MSKDLFQLMREEEIETNNFLPNKKEIHASAKTFIKKMVDAGEDNLYERLSQIRRTKEALITMEGELLNFIPQENFESFGLKGTYRSGGSVANYEDDTFYASLKRKLEERKMQLDLALKTDEVFYDGTGVEVPKVSKTERKSSLSITF